MAKTYTFNRKAISGFIIRVASRRTDYPFVGYYCNDGTIVTDFTKARNWPSAKLAADAVPTVKALLRRTA
jgi:hypothetical protein